MENTPEYPENHDPERPLECSECKKPIVVHYTEVVGGASMHTGMCSECPQLQRKLKGLAHEDDAATLWGGAAGLVCGNCGTTLENYQVSHSLGCSNCYEVFEDAIQDEMNKLNKISPSITKRKKAVPLHVGRTPGEVHEVSSSLRLIALNEALEETLKREDYEQAAWLRDQIRAITDKPEESDDAAQ